MNLVPYTVRLYRSGPKADTFTQEELERIQHGHLDFVASQREWTYANGPFRDQPDQSGFGLGRADGTQVVNRVERRPGIAGPGRKE